MTEDPLAQLRDIHLPEAIGWWPPAMGWWWLMLMVIATIAAMIYWIVKRNKQQSYRKDAIALLDDCYRQWLASNNDVDCFNTINTLLKRTALSAFPESDAKALYGRQWLEFLNGKCRLKPFNQALINDFSHCQYQCDITLDIEQFYRSSRQWITHHANV